MNLVDDVARGACDANDHLVRSALRAVIVCGVTDPGGVSSNRDNCVSKVTTCQQLGTG